VEASVLGEGIGEVGAEGLVLLLVLFDFLAGEERQGFQGRVGGDFVGFVFLLIELVGFGEEDLLEECCKFCVLECAQAGGVEGFFVGDEVTGGRHEYSMR